MLLQFYKMIINNNEQLLLIIMCPDRSDRSFICNTGFNLEMYY